MRDTTPSDIGWIGALLYYFTLGDQQQNCYSIRNFSSPIIYTNTMYTHCLVSQR